MYNLKTLKTFFVQTINWISIQQIFSLRISNTAKYLPLLCIPDIIHNVIPKKYLLFINKVLPPWPSFVKKMYSRVGQFFRMQNNSVW